LILTLLLLRLPPRPTLFPYTTLFRSLEPQYRSVPPCRGAPQTLRGEGHGEVEQRPDQSRLQSCEVAQGRNLQPGAVDRRSKHARDRKSTRLNSSHVAISYAVFCLKKK